MADTLRAAIDRLNIAGVDNPQLDARLLFCHALGLDRAGLLSQSRREPTIPEIKKIETLLQRREKRESVARIIGQREFWGLPFGMNEATLEPRPDSETLVEAVLSSFRRKPESSGSFSLDPGLRRNDAISCESFAPRILDLGTGTGCLLLALLHEWPHATGVGIDIAPRAVAQASQNAAGLGLDTRAAFRTGNWFDGITGKFDIIISNPPYIPAADIETLMPEVRDHDPRAALDGGADGLEPYRFLIPQLPAFLNANGFVIFEVGIDQAQDVAALLRAHAFADVAIHKDLGGIDRCVSAYIS
ncbi:MAG: peptide chain release factor N(5)-glutamine methyltransferase [Alphaproteobacteria bacterium]|nr:peptide chain release factor N(5)-glutamine methyltransferase [Alphaproteobacteria bacterium]